MGQNQYLVYYLGGDVRDGTPDLAFDPALGLPLRVAVGQYVKKGKWDEKIPYPANKGMVLAERHDYHNVFIHEDDMAEFKRRLTAHRSR
jgi:catechol 2,3-dioxygenase-like lactoylglutathione lyase family enzyme